MNAEALAGLTLRLTGKAIRPGDSDYDEARRIWNGTIDKKPGVIVRCRSVDDVIAAVNFARAEGSRGLLPTPRAAPTSTSRTPTTSRASKLSTAPTTNVSWRSSVVTIRRAFSAPVANCASAGQETGRLA